jgi:hypothetical protein
VDKAKADRAAATAAVDSTKTVLAKAIDDLAKAQAAYDAAWKALVDAGPNPPTPPVPPVDPPKPPDPPNPPPGPQPIAAGKLWLICVLPDLTKQTPAQAKILASAELHKLLDSKGNHFRWTDAAHAPPDLVPYVRRVAPDQGPRAFVSDADEKDWTKALRESVPLTDEAALIALLQKWGGK